MCLVVPIFLFFWEQSYTSKKSVKIVFWHFTLAARRKLKISFDWNVVDTMSISNMKVEHLTKAPTVVGDSSIDDLLLKSYGFGH